MAQIVFTALRCSVCVFCNLINILVDLIEWVKGKWKESLKWMAPNLSEQRARLQKRREESAVNGQELCEDTQTERKYLVSNEDHIDQLKLFGKTTLRSMHKCNVTVFLVLIVLCGLNFQFESCANA